MKFSDLKHEKFIQIPNIELKTLDGKKFNFSDTKLNNVSVFIFLSPECPLCINYTLSINQIFNRFDSINVKVKPTFYGVFPGKYYSKKQINHYVKKYGMKFTMLLDPDYKLTKNLKATITPEVVVMNMKGEIAYSGKIDNWVYELGKKRTVITEFYLVNAINAILEGKEILIKKTEAIGCLISSNP